MKIEWGECKGFWEKWHCYSWEDEDGQWQWKAILYCPDFVSINGFAKSKHDGRFKVGKAIKRWQKGGEQ